MNTVKRVMSSLLVIAALAMILSACGSSEPCESCGNTPTKAYTNNYSGEKEYYCSRCSSDCAFCSKKATRHYTSLIGIIFVCDGCYKEILDLNS